MNYREITRRLNDEGIEITHQAVEQFLQGRVKRSAHGGRILSVALSVTHEHLTDHFDDMRSALERLETMPTERRGGPRQTAA